MFDRMFGAMRRHRTAQRTRSELSRLSDRELNDIGISRGEILEIARRTAY